MTVERVLKRALRSGLLVLATTLSAFCFAQGLGVGQGAATGSSGSNTQREGKPAAATRWTPVKGQAIDLTINPKGDVYALDPTGRLWRLPADEARTGGSGWLTQPGRYKRVRATHDGSMWAIDPYDMLFRLQGSVWYPVVGPVRDVAAAADGQATILTMEGRLFDLYTALPYTPAPPESASPAVTLVLDAYGLPWLQRQDRSVVRYTGTAWQTVARAADQMGMVAAGYDGAIIGVSADGRIARYDALRNFWLPYLGEGQSIPPMNQVALSPIGLPWGISRSGELLAERPVGTPPPVVASPSVFTRLLSWQSTGRQAAQVSVGQDGTVYTVEPDGSLWQRKRGKEWARMSLEGQVKAIASGTDRRVWILTDKGALRQLNKNGFAISLQDLPQVKLIAAGPKDTLWAINSQDMLFRWNAPAAKWDPPLQLPSAASALAIGPREEPWFIDAKGEVRTRRQNGEWITIKDFQATSISVGPEGTIYATGKDERIFWLEVREMGWKPASGKAVQIAVGPGGAPWAITAKNELLISGRVADEPATRETTQTATRKTTSTTASSSDSSTTSSTSSTTTATATASDTGTGAPSAFVLVPPGASGPVLGVPGAATPGGFVSVPTMVFGSTAGFVVTGPKPSSLKPLSYSTITSDARFSDIGIGINGAVFASSTDGSLMCFSNPDNRFVLASSGVSSRVAVAADGKPWIIDTNGGVSRFDKAGGGWRTVPGFAAVDISFGPDGQLWGASRAGTVHRYNAVTDSFFDAEPVLTSDVSFRTRRVAGANTRVYWVVSEQGQLIRCEKGDCRVVLVGAVDIAVAPDNTLFALDLLGNVLRYDQTKKVLERQNGSGTAIAVGPGGLPWLVTAAGKIDSSGVFATSNKAVNAADCASAFAATPAPLPPPPSVVLVANADSATVAPGGSLDLLANDKFAGRAASIGDVTVSLDTTSNLLALSGGTVVLSSNATAGTVLSGSYKICPRNVLGNCVSSTVTITVSGTSTAPTAVTAVGGDRQATISFTAPGVGGVSSYSVASSDGTLTANGTTSPITVIGLTNGTQYSFTVTAKFTNGTSKTSELSNTIVPSATITEPGAPTIGTAVAGNAQATVSFTAPGSNGGASITSYTVTSLPDGKTATGTSSPITVTGLVNGTVYTFTVRAQNLIGLGAPSAASNSVTPPGAGAATVPGAPTGVNSVFAGPGVLQVNFTAPASNGGSAITNYTATSSPGGLTGTSSSSPIFVTGLTGGTTYTFTVTATNAAGTGAASAASVGVLAQDVPGAPTILSTSPGGPGQLVVSFTVPASNGSAISGYQSGCIDTGATGTPPFLPIGPFPGGASPITINGLTTGNTYACDAQAINGVGPGPPSASGTPTIAP